VQLKHIQSVLLMLCGWAAGAVASEFGEFEGDPTRGKALYPVCSACHGPAGEGNQAMSAPRIAGQEPWYLVRQMQLFQSGARGAAPGDMQGMQMAAMAKGPQFGTEQALHDLAAFIAALDAEPQAPTVVGDPDAGEALYAPCAACHGIHGEGIEDLAGPRLSGQSDWYLATQIRKFKAGQRGDHDMDHGGRQMRPMVDTLDTEQSVNDVVAYINTLP
jgi:cytochrome c oxidase subunit 2